MNGIASMTGEQKSKMLLYIALDLIFINFSILAAICLWYGGSIPGLPGGLRYVNIPESVWEWYKYTVLFISP
ncbi:MAG: hypothetical protein IJL89_02645, partial [Firmicutes bacterium]|nr:hypothetical protein [Bacillota bacterium]